MHFIVVERFAMSLCLRIGFLKRREILALVHLFKTSFTSILEANYIAARCFLISNRVWRSLGSLMIGLLESVL